MKKLVLFSFAMSLMGCASHIYAPSKAQLTENKATLTVSYETGENVSFWDSSKPKLTLASNSYACKNQGSLDWGKFVTSADGRQSYKNPDILGSLTVSSGQPQKTIPIPANKPIFIKLEELDCTLVSHFIPEETKAYQLSVNTQNARTQGCSLTLTDEETRPVENFTVKRGLRLAHPVCL